MQAGQWVKVILLKDTLIGMYGIGYTDRIQLTSVYQLIETPTMRIACPGCGKSKKCTDADIDQMLQNEAPPLNCPQSSQCDPSSWKTFPDPREINQEYVYLGEEAEIPVSAVRFLHTIEKPECVE